MIVHVDGDTWCGAVVDLRGSGIDGRDVASAIRGEDSPCGVVCPAPGPLHEYVGHVHDEMGIRTRTALAAAARSRGHGAPQDTQLERLRERRAAIEVAEARARTAGAPETDVQELRERIAELRGRIQTLAECGEDASEERAALRRSAARLSEVETRRVAAGERRQQARPDRDRRERRMRLEDRIANRERAARTHLVDAVREPYVRALWALDPTADPFEADPVVEALAVLRVATVRAPVVLGTEWFPTPAAAAAWIDAPVVAV